MTEDRRIDNLERRHLAAEARWLAKQERLDQLAEPLIGELCRNGRTVYYVNTLKGPREGDRPALVAFLARNNYI